MTRQPKAQAWSIPAPIWPLKTSHNSISSTSKNPFMISIIDTRHACSVHAYMKTNISYSFKVNKSFKECNDFMD